MATMSCDNNKNIALKIKYSLNTTDNKFQKIEKKIIKFTKKKKMECHLMRVEPSTPCLLERLAYETGALPLS